MDYFRRKVSSSGALRALRYLSAEGSEDTVAAGLSEYFTGLIQRVEASDQVHNGGTDKNGFYKPTKTIVLKHLHLLRDLHDKPRARAMVKTAWEQVVSELPPEWLVLPPELKAELRRILDAKS